MNGILLVLALLFLLVALTTRAATVLTVRPASLHERTPMNLALLLALLGIIGILSLLADYALKREQSAALPARAASQETCPCCDEPVDAADDYCGSCGCALR